MGCTSSRFDRRNKLAGDYNTVQSQFIGGDSHEFDDFPYDRVQWAFDKEKETGDLFKVDVDLKATDQEQIKSIYRATLTHAQECLKHLEEKHGSNSDPKGVMLHDKYVHTDAIKQMKEVVEFLTAHSGVSLVDAAPATEAKMEGEAMMMEGGEDAAMADVDPGAGMGMDKHDCNPFKYEEDSRSYDGWEQVPALLLRSMIVNPFWGDAVKAEAIGWEFNPKKGPGCCGHEPHYTGAAGLVASAVSKSATEA